MRSERLSIKLIDATEGGTELAYKHFNQQTSGVVQTCLYRLRCECKQSANGSGVMPSTTQTTNTMRSSSGNSIYRPFQGVSDPRRPSSTPGATPCNNPPSAARSEPDPSNGASNKISLSEPLGCSTARGAASLRMSTDVTTTQASSRPFPQPGPSHDRLHGNCSLLEMLQGWKAHSTSNARAMGNFRKRRWNSDLLPKLAPVQGSGLTSDTSGNCFAVGSPDPIRRSTRALRRGRVSQRPSDRLQASCRREHRPR